MVYKNDANQPAIIEALAAVGCSVSQIQGKGRCVGVPDLLVGFSGYNYLLEVKSDRGQLDRGQEIWHGAWRGTVHIVRTPAEALNAVGFFVTSQEDTSGEPKVENSESPQSKRRPGRPAKTADR